MKRKTQIVRRLRRKAKRLARWASWSALFHGPAVAPSGDAAGVMIVTDPHGTFAVAGFAFPKSTHENPNATMGMVFDAHSHAVVAEGVRSLPEAKRLGEAWLKKYRKGLVLAPCDCETLTEASVPAGARHVATRSSATRRASSRSDASRSADPRRVRRKAA